MTTTSVRADRVSQAQPALDRRAFPRRRARGTPRCRPCNRPFDPGILAELVDVSQGGIGLVVRELYEAGKALEIEINRPGGRQRLVCQAEVKWTAPVSDGRYRIGCCWEHRLSFGELQSVI